MLKIKHIVAVLAFALAATFFAPADAQAQATAPTAVTAVKSNADVTLTWTNTTGAEHFVRWRSGTSGNWLSSDTVGASVGGSDDNTACAVTGTADKSACGIDRTDQSGGLTITGLTANTSYTFAVAAHTSGDTSSSAWVAATAITTNRDTANLATLQIFEDGAFMDEATLNETVAATTLDYTTTVRSGWDRGRIKATTTGFGATILVGARGTSVADAAVSAVDPILVDPANGKTAHNFGGARTYYFAIVVIAENDVTRKTYSITVTRHDNTVKTLDALELSGITLVPPFASDTFNYTASVSYGTNNTTVTATPTDGDASVTGHTGSQSLMVGAITLTVTVNDAAGGSAPTNLQDYVIMVTRAAPVLTDITISSGTVTGAASFDFGERSYMGNAEPDVANIQFTARFGAGGALTIQKSGVGSPATLTDNTPSTDIPLTDGENVINLIYTEDSLSTTFAYTITKRVIGTDASFSALSFDDRVNLAGFTPGAINSDGSDFVFNLSRPFTTTSVRIRSVLTDPRAVTSGTGNFPLNVGSNTRRITVTAEDGTTMQSYRINIERAAPDVSDIVISMPAGTTYTPAFAAGTRMYAASVGSEVANVQFTATFSTGTIGIRKGSSGATTDLPTATASANIALDAGDTEINLVYTESSTNYAYVYTITQAADVATLSGITLADSDGMALSLVENFDAGTLAYTYAATYNIDSIEVGATATNPSASVSGTGTISVPLGESTITLTVTPAGDGTSSDYTITVTRAFPPVGALEITNADALDTASFSVEDEFEQSGTVDARFTATAPLEVVLRNGATGTIHYRLGRSGNWVAATVVNTVRTFNPTGAVANAVVVQMRYRQTRGSNNIDTIYTFTVIQPSLAPAAPTVDGNDEQLNVSWDAPSDTGGGTISEYTVEWSVANADAYDNSATATGTSYAITGLANGDSFDVRVRGTNEAGGGATSAATAGTAAIPGVPEAPTAPMAESEANGELTLEWTDPTPAEGEAPITNYRVRWKLNSASDFGSPIQARAMPFTLTDLENDTAYDVEVAAANARGIGAYSATVTATTGVDTAPSAPRALDDEPSVVAAPASITVKWQAPDELGSGALTGYSVEWKLSTAGAYLDVAANQAAITTTDATASQEHTFTQIADGSGTAAAIVNGTNYDVRIIAMTDATTNDGASPALTFADVPSGTPAAVTPSEPRNIKFVAGDGELMVSWDAPHHGEADTYDVRWKKVNAAFVDGDSRVGVTEMFLTITGVDNGVPYEVEVRAVAADDPDADTDLERGAFAAATGTPGAASAPTAPRFLEVTGSNGGLALQWAPPADTGGTITKYEVRHKLASESRYGAPVDAATMQTHRIPDLMRGMQYDVQVAAVNSVARGLWAGLRATPAGLPSAPRTVQLTPTDASMTVTWRVPESDGGAQLENYVVEWKLASTPAGITSAKVNGTRYTIEENTDIGISALTNDLVYEVRVAATNRFGEVYSAAVQAAPAAEAVVPSVPQKVEVKNAGETSLTISWDAPTSNGGQPITGYDVSWKLSSEATYPAENVRSVGANATSATLTGLTADMPYEVRVAAKNGVGEAGDLIQSAAVAQTPAAIAALDDDSSLSALVIETPGPTLQVLTKLNPADGVAATGFLADHETYSAPEVLYATEMLLVSPTAADTSTIEIGVDRLADADSGTAATTEIGVGDNIVRIKVTAEDGSATTYTVAVTRRGPASFTSLELTGVMLKEEFAPNQTEYSFDVAPSLTQVTLKGTFTGDAVIRHSGDPAMGFTSDSVSTPIPLGAGANQVVIAYTEGNITTDYRFTFNVPVAASTGRIESFLSSAGAAILSSALDVIGDNAINAPAGNMNTAFLRDNYNTRTENALALLSEEPQYRDTDWRDLLGASSFRLALNHEDGEDGGGEHAGQWSVWGAGDVRAFASSGDTETEGMGYSGYLGTDYRAKDWLAGIAVGYTTSAGSITTPESETDAEFWLAAGYPYVRYSPTETVDIWLMAGVGAGTFTLDEPDPDTPSEKYTVLLLHHLYALGAKAELARAGDFSVAAKTDGSAYFATSLSGEDDDIDVMQQRFRIALDFAYDYKTEAHALRPHLEVGGRFDFGNAEADLLMGAEIAAGVRYEHLASRFSIDARGRALVYDNSDSSTVGTPGILREWGAGATLRLAPNALGTGLSASLTPGWGTPASRADDMWNSNGELTLVDPSNAASLSAELAYTMRHKQALVTPLAQYSLNAAHQTVGIGTRLNLSVLSMELLGEQVARTATATDEYRLRLTSKLRF